MIAISLGIFAAILYVSTFLISTSTTQVGVDSAFRAVENIREAADFIYIHGHPSKIQREVRIPQSVDYLNISENVIRLRINSDPSHTDIYEVAKGNLSSDLSLICSPVCRGGNYVLVFESLSPDWPFDLNITCSS